MGELDALRAREKEIAEKIEAKRKARASADAEREARDRVAAAENELQLEELRDQFAGEGEEGVDFTICDLTRIGCGFVIVKRGASVLVRKFKSKFKGDAVPTEADTQSLVKACLLHPTADDFNRIVDGHDFVAAKIANVICEMHGVGLEMKGGKR